jgi:hypothetical protein
MEEVLENRLILGDIKTIQYLPPCMAALNDNHIGEYVIVRYKGKWELCLVVDVAQDIHRSKRVRNNLIVEVDYESARRLGISSGIIEEAKVALLDVPDWLRYDWYRYDMEGIRSR